MRNELEKRLDSLQEGLSNADKKLRREMAPGRQEILDRIMEAIGGRKDEIEGWLKSDHNGFPWDYEGNGRNNLDFNFCVQYRWNDGVLEF